MSKEYYIIIRDIGGKTDDFTVSEHVLEDVLSNVKKGVWFEIPARNKEWSGNDAIFYAGGIVVSVRVRPSR